MVAVVNGYTCFTTCDAAAARQGRDPSKPIGSPPDGPGAANARFDRHATVFGGVLMDLLAGRADASSPSGADGIVKRSVDILV